MYLMYAGHRPGMVLGTKDETEQFRPKSHLSGPSMPVAGGDHTGAAGCPVASEGTRWEVKLRGHRVVETTVPSQVAGAR